MKIDFNDPLVQRAIMRQALDDIQRTSIIGQILRPPPPPGPVFIDPDMRDHDLLAVDSRTVVLTPKKRGA